MMMVPTLLSHGKLQLPTNVIRFLYRFLYYVCRGGIDEINDFKGCPLKSYDEPRSTVRWATDGIRSCTWIPWIHFSGCTYSRYAHLVHKYGWEHWEPFDK